MFVLSTKHTYIVDLILLYSMFVVSKNSIMKKGGHIHNVVNTRLLERSSSFCDSLKISKSTSPLIYYTTSLHSSFFFFFLLCLSFVFFSQSLPFSLWCFSHLFPKASFAKERNSHLLSDYVSFFFSFLFFSSFRSLSLAAHQLPYIFSYVFPLLDPLL